VKKKFNITLFGGSGFLGSHVADKLTEDGHKVCIFDFKKSKWLRKDQEMIVGDISDFAQVTNALKNTDIVYNLAAISDIEEGI
jgi:UDP-glucose 4-epimerase